VLHAFGEPRTYGAGSFTRRLIDAAMHADQSNRARLALAFPGLVSAIAAAKDEPEGMAALRVIAGLEQVQP